MFQEYPKVMHSPQGAEKTVRSSEHEQELRAAGWIDGHQFWAAKAAPVTSLIPPTNKDTGVNPSADASGETNTEQNERVNEDLQASAGRSVAPQAPAKPRKPRRGAGGSGSPASAPEPGRS